MVMGETLAEADMEADTEVVTVEDMVVVMAEATEVASNKEEVTKKLKQ